MPQQTKIDTSILLVVLSENKHEFYNEFENKIYGPSHQCWQMLVEKLPFPISKKYIYTLVILNRYDIHTKLGLKLTTTPTVNSNNFIEPCLSESEDDVAKKDDQLLFKITLSSEEWMHIHQNNLVTYRRCDQSDRKKASRECDILTPFEWTKVFNEHFFALTKLPCSISFKRGKVLPEGNQYLKVEGQCTWCESMFLGIVEHAPLSNSKIVVDCSFSGKFKTCDSKKKRRIIGKQRDEFRNKMIEQNMSGAFVQRLEAQKVMEFGDPEPSSLPTLNALRVLKYKAKQESIINKNPILALTELKGAVPYNDIIKDIGYDRFFIHYWTAMELNTYRTYARRTSIPTISIDATGSLVKPIILNSGRRTGPIFLYQIAVMDYEAKSQYAVCHMLTERHNNNAIAYWLSEWISNSVPVPKVVVTDQSKALMMAVVKAFTQYSSLHKYIAVCEALVKSEENVEIPSCMLRLDFNHTMHLISSWNELKMAPRRVKQFYLRAIGLVISSKNFEEISHLLKCIFTVALNEEDGYNKHKEPTDCETAKNYLKNKIAGHDYDNNEIGEGIDKGGVNRNESDLIVEEDDSYKECSVFQDIKLIYSTCQFNSLGEQNCGDHDNLQYSPSIAKKFVDFCKYITLWSAVMVPIFKFGGKTETSASSESLFNDLKNNIFKHIQIPTRVDEFLITHIESIIGQMNIVRSKYPKEETLKTNLTEKVIELASEDWKGQVSKNENISHKSKKNYLNAYPEIMNTNIDSKAKCGVIGLIKNGNNHQLKGVWIDNKNITAINTCGFDSIAQIMSVCYADSSSYSSFVDSNVRDCLFFEMVAHLIRDGVTVQFYRKRAEILLEILKENTVTQHECTTINAACTANYLLQNLFPNFPSYSETLMCVKCEKNDSRAFKTLVVNLINETLKLLPTIVSEYFEDCSRCHSCGTSSKRNILLGSHIFIELSNKNSKNDVCVQLTDIPKCLSVKQKQFYLKGVISFIPPISKSLSAIGHYVAYCWRNNVAVWEKYDDISNRITTVRQSAIVSCQFLVYVL